MRLLFSIVILFVLGCHNGSETLPDPRDLNDNPDPTNLTVANPQPDATPPPPDLFRKGVTLVCWSPGCFSEEPETALMLDYLQSLGVEWLSIVPTWYQEGTYSSIIYSNPTRSPTDEDIRSVISLARARGFKILLKPHIDLESGGWTRLAINPRNLVEWQENYREFISHYARLGEELQVEIFSIGTELRWRSSHLVFWSGIIDTVRSLYRGSLTYAANWNEYSQVSFWDRLDYIGINFYFPLTTNVNATQADMEAGLQRIGQTLQAFAAARERPILLTEIGYRSMDGANVLPYNSTLVRTLDLQEQADAYAAVLTAYNNLDWLRGIFWWRADPRPIGGPADDSYLFYDKPAADVLGRFWR